MTEQPRDQQAPPELYEDDVALFMPPDELAGQPAQDRLAPFNQVAEESILGCCMIDSESALAVCIDTGLMASDFYIVKNGWIYSVIQGLYQSDAAIDTITVCEMLESQHRLTESGGPGYIALLINAVPTAIHAGAYARIVKGKSIRRTILAASSTLAELALQEDRHWKEVLDDAERLVFGLTPTNAQYDLRHIAGDVSVFYDRLQEMQDGAIPGLLTGLTDLDAILGGMHKGDLLVVAARPGMGKTSLLLNLACNVAWSDKGVAIFSLEMSREQIINRLVSMHAELDSNALRLGRIEDDEWSMIVEAAGRLSDLKIYVDDTPGISPLKIKNKVRRLARSNPLDLILIDYLQLMAGDVPKENRVQEMSVISKMLKQLARELDIPIIAAAQLNRGVEHRSDKRPVISDLRDSGALEEDADVVMLLYRDEYYDPTTELKNIADIIVGKHRHGPTGTAQVHFRKQTTQFLNAEMQQTLFDFLE